MVVSSLSENLLDHVRRNFRMIQDQWEMEKGKQINALQICEVKRRKSNTKNLAEEVKSRRTLKDQSLIIEEEETLLSFLNKLSAGENCVR